MNVLIPNMSEEGRKYEKTISKIECLCLGSMIDQEEDDSGNWMKIAHTTIITKMIQCLADWEKIHTYIVLKGRGIEGNGEGKTVWKDAEWLERINQREMWLAKGVVDQLQELAQFELDNRGLHCEVDIWPILVDYGWAWYQKIER